LSNLKKTRDDKLKLDVVIGRNMRREREFRKLTREDFAKILGLTTSHLGLIERGERGATGVTLDRVSRALGISIDSLFSETGRAAFAREKQDAEAIARKKITTLLVAFTKQELVFLSHVIKGMFAARNADELENMLDEN